MENTHQCKSMHAVEAWITNAGNEWHLNINRVATEQDLEENHYLEEVGQTIESVAINILYCPYCGEKLSHSQGECIPSFRHNDYSKW